MILSFRPILVVVFCCVIFSSSYPFSFSESFTKTKQTIGHWLTPKQTQHIAKEHPISASEKITVHNKQGSVTVTTWNKQLVMIDAVKRGTQEQLDTTNFTVTTANQMITIATQVGTEEPGAIIDYTLVIPAKTPLTIITESGAISVTGNNAHVDVQTASGDIHAEQIQSSLRAQALNGSIFIEQPFFAHNNDEASIFAEAKYDITLLMPENANTNIRATTLLGTIFSDIFITLNPITVQLNKDSYKQMQRSIRGTTGMGGMPITLESTNGTIKILGS